MGIRFVCIAATMVLTACSPETGDGSSDTAQMGEGIAKPAQIAPGQIRLAGDNITITGPMGTTLPFGSPRDVVDAELTRTIGPPADRSSIAECGAGAMDFTNYPGGLKVNFQGGKLVGWFLDQEAGSAIKADREIVPGSTEVAVKRAYRMERMDSTLGDEFYSDEKIGGFFAESAASSGDEKTVKSLFAGTNCFFR